MSPALADILKLWQQPKRQERYLCALIDDESVRTSERLEAINVLGALHLHRNELRRAIFVFKRTIAMDPFSKQAIWAMKLLSCVYSKIGRRGERVNVDSQRMHALRRLARTSVDSGDVHFAFSELIREYTDLDMPDIAEAYFNEYRAHCDSGPIHEK